MSDTETAPPSTPYSEQRKVVLRTAPDAIAANRDLALNPSANPPGNQRGANPPDQNRTDSERLPRYVFTDNNRTGIETVESRRIRKKFAAFGGPDNHLSEDMVGGITDGDLYLPGLSSCIGVLCVLGNRLTGGHFTVSTDPTLLFSVWNSELNQPKPIRALYIFGPHVKWMPEKAFKTKGAKIGEGNGVGAVVAYFKKELGFAGAVQTFDQEGGNPPKSFRYKAEFRGGRFVLGRAEEVGSAAPPESAYERLVG